MEEKTRMVTLHKHVTDFDGVVWQLEINGVNTGIGLTQELIDDIPSDQRCDMLDEIVNVLAAGLADNGYALTDKEKNNFNKLLQCMT